MRVEKVVVEYDNDTSITGQQTPVWSTSFELGANWQAPGANRLIVTGSNNVSRTLYLAPVGVNETLTSLALPQLGTVDRPQIWRIVPRTTINAETDPVAIVGLLCLIAVFVGSVVWLLDIWRRRRAGKTDDALN